MCVRYLGFVLLVWCPGVLYVQSAEQSCTAPDLKGGYVVPEKVIYLHGTQLTYACDNGLKPAVEGWWVTSTCQNGKWSPKPQCVVESACLPPTIPNANYIENQNGWYENEHTLRITCEKGYVHKNNDATAKCISGTWSSVPVCEKSNDTCSEPPKILHAVVIHQEYQELFAEDSTVQYECEHGYTAKEEDKKTIYCIAGNWSEGPTCSPGQGGSTVGGHTTSAGIGTRGGTGTGVGTGHGVSTVEGTGSSGSSGSIGRDTDPQITTISRCGTPPIVLNSIVETYPMYLKYKCGVFYTRVGPEKVVCYNDGTWSQVPTCKDAFCSVNTEEYPALKPDGVKFVRDGETVRLECVRQDHWWTDHYSVGRCTNGRMTLSHCRSWLQLKFC
uniref:complement factor H-like isoform X2 n=1 Tax=Scatophagus argus TaxID=75038 RepID=UPI001ED7F8AC|nr:complement factor H-like isoform X2 [Scatophagus argus]